jgi:hypothetical protein
MTADEAVAGRCSRRSCRGGRGPNQKYGSTREAVPGSSDSKQIWQKTSQMLKHEGLQFRIKRGQCLEIIAANLLKEKKPR